jgi:chromosome segregation ATPase
MAAMLIGFGTARAGELKVMVPVDDYKKMQSKLESLEQENSQLKRAVGSSGMVGGSGQDSTVQQSRLSNLEEENARLRQQLQSQPGQTSDDLASRISALEQENSQLQQQLAEKQGQDEMAGTDSAVAARLAELENENMQLKQQVRAVKEGAVAAFITGDQTTARHLYATARHARTFHNFKF